MTNSPIRPVVIRCPHYVRCSSKQGTDEIICLAFNPAVKTEVLKADLCPEARSKRHAQETAERFEDASVVVDTHFEVEGDEIG